VLNALSEHPEIGAVTIPPIVYVTGMARSGTTLLHNLVALLDQQRAGRRATPPATLDTMGYDPLEVRQDPAVRGYCERFAVSPELVRLTGAAPPV
jgi:hypothetical protein